MGINDDPDPESMGCGYNVIKEIDEIRALVAVLKDSDITPALIERNQERFTFILSQYQDQPHLLDPYLEDILGSMLNIVRDGNVSDNVKHNVFKYIFIIMSVKTYKKVASYLPHEVIFIKIFAILYPISNLFEYCLINLIFLPLISVQN